MKNNSSVIGHDTMSSAIKDAHNYHSWLCELVLSEMGTNILEIGPGYGQYTKIFSEQARYITAADIDTHCVESLQQTMPAYEKNKAEVRACVADLNSDSWIDAVKSNKPFDTVIALNVLEHLEDDTATLNRISKVMASGGKLLLILPAHAALFGPMDTMAGHYRRYSKNYFSKQLTKAGFSIKGLHYINPIGGLGWYVNAKLYKPKTLSDEGVNKQIILFDKYLLPISKLFTPLFKTFFGQSLWCCAFKI